LEQCFLWVGIFLDQYPWVIIFGAIFFGSMFFKNGCFGEVSLLGLVFLGMFLGTTLSQLIPAFYELTMVFAPL